jgi:glycosyltransferase involved in cell wall biosynthesis
MLGHIDLVEDGHIHGWHVAASSDPLAVKIDGKLVGIVKGSLERLDVVSLGLAPANSGFAFELPARLNDDQVHEVAIHPLGHRADQVIQERIVFPSETRLAPRAVGRAAVVCWDLAHNPAGRAFALARVLQKIYRKVDIIGPLHPAFGKAVWAPIRYEKNLGFISRAYEGTQTYEALAELANQNRYDFVHICKPRWPAVHIGFKIIEQSGCAFGIDIDDHELSFFNNKLSAPVIDFLAIKAAVDDKKLSPYGLEATYTTIEAIKDCPLITVSNPALQKEYGGVIIPHAREADIFDPAHFDREACRLALGYDEFDKVLLFCGTVRPHKGVDMLARYVASIRSKNVKLCIVGDMPDKKFAKTLYDILPGRINIHTPRTMAQLPTLNIAADLVCLPQDVESSISQFQFPAKLIDALAMGTPTLVPDLPPFEAVKQLEGVNILQTKAVGRQIANLLKQPNDRDSIRAGFLASLSSLAAANVLRTEIDRAFGAVSVAELGRMTPRAISGAEPFNPSGPSGNINVLGASKPDLVFLWKQNDSGLFGRRADMVSKYLLDTDSVRRVVHIEQSVVLDEVIRLQNGASRYNSNSLILKNISARWLGLNDSGRRLNKTFVVDKKARQFLGTDTIKPENLSEAYRAYFDEIGISSDAILWICPVFFDLEHVLRANRFAFIISDIIDDQREFTQNDSFRTRLDANYSAALSVSNLVIGNCMKVLENMRAKINSRSIIAPNAAESLDKFRDMAVNRRAQNKRKIIGYVGNLRDRIDVELIERLAKQFSECDIVLVGPTGGNKPVENLSIIKNITIMGPAKYEDALEFMTFFDVAIIPHTVDKLTDTMNPLKAYTYNEIGLPIVSTCVSNMGDISGILYASSQQEFCDHVNNVLYSNLKLDVTKVSKSVHWADRVRAIWQVIARENNGIMAMFKKAAL